MTPLVFIAGTFILMTSFSGKLFMWGAFGRILQNNLRFFITFALGVFITTLYLVFTEATETTLSLGAIALAAALGALLLEVVHRIIPEAHHHHGSDEDDCCDRIHKINPRRILAGDAIHNIGDGVILVGAFLTDIRAGIVLTLGIMMHEFVQETSEFFLLKEAGYSTRRALMSNFAVQTSTFIGIIFALLISNTTPYTPVLTALTLGSLSYIIIRDLAPHVITSIIHKGNAAIHALCLICGIAIMLTLATILPG